MKNILFRGTFERILRENMETLTPKKIASELDKFVIGQNLAKTAVSIALRNRWRRQQLGPDMRDEIAPKKYYYDRTYRGWQNRDCSKVVTTG